ncbi:unnamed protein product [Didymodactylos carnosus]|uniref:Iodothyronine deiodinase n=1 Tax=Didymodactylos carnosus TaxID=1234261 RepID=A0A814PVY3_9BILA|nr:unnamed protein product [Didymodactylos carnosus]CAF3876032.1 unnamed protein product [Didymodactylos carnosus]
MGIGRYGSKQQSQHSVLETNEKFVKEIEIKYKGAKDIQHEDKPPERSRLNIGSIISFGNRMFFPSSSHCGFDVLKEKTQDSFIYDQDANELIASNEDKNNLSDDLPPLEIVQQMIVYETHLRLSESVQQLMDFYHEDEHAVTLIHDYLQKSVVEKFGYKHVNALRTALARFPDDPIVQSAFYIKYNRITQGKMNVDEPVIDIDLYKLNGEQTTLLSQICLNHRPMILVAGSTEAHAKDQWPIGKTISCNNQPKIMEERLEIANRFCNEFKLEMPVLIDNMDNTFHSTYGAWPFRFYIIHNGKLVFKAQPGQDNYAYNLDELDEWIEQYRHQIQEQ